VAAAATTTTATATTTTTTTSVVEKDPSLLLSSPQDKQQTARENFEKGLDLAEMTGVLYDKAEAFEGLSKINAAELNYEEAFRYEQLLAEVKDKIKEEFRKKEIFVSILNPSYKGVYDEFIRR